MKIDVLVKIVKILDLCNKPNYSAISFTHYEDRCISENCQDIGFMQQTQLFLFCEANI